MRPLAPINVVSNARHHMEGTKQMTVLAWKSSNMAELKAPRVGSAAVVLDDHNRVLLGRRNKEPNRGRWVLPGGKVRLFEPVATAASREIGEETGLVVEVTGQVGTFEIINPPTEHRLIVYSSARPVGGRLRAGSDISELRFVTQEEFESLDTTEIVSRVLTRTGWLVSQGSQLAAAAEGSLSRY